MNARAGAHFENDRRLADVGIVKLAELESMRGIESYHDFVKTALPQADMQMDAADETWVKLENGVIVGHFSLWYCDTPDYEGKSAGYVGHYYSKTPAVGTEILEAAARLLKIYGCKIAIGPVDGNTWRRYRLACGTTGIPKFLLEPDNPMDYPKHFLDSGFQTIATYSSSILEVKPNFVDALNMESMMLPGVTIRSINLGQFEEELRKIYGIACDAFGDAFLYSEISETEFIQRYKKLRPIVNPELVLIAEQNDHAVGFLLAVSDPANSNNAIKTVIAKTIGRIKDDRYHGLGVRLMAECHARAARLGFSNMIHALYKDDNNSSIYSTIHDANVFRKYAVYGKYL